MPFRFFTIPVLHGEAAEKELNDFLAAHLTTQVERHFVSDGGQSFWAVSVIFTAGRKPASPNSNTSSAPHRSDIPADYKPKVDYEEILNPEQYILYEQLREMRNRIADENKVPAYNVFNNAQLAAMARDRPGTAADLLKIEGVGEKKVGKFGETFVDFLKDSAGSANGTPETAKAEA